MRRLACLAAALWSLALVSTVSAFPERVEEVWRSPYGDDRTYGLEHAFAPSPSDRSFWMIEGATVAHYDADGTMLSRSQALYTPWVLEADPADGSCWVLQASKDELLHFDVEGTLLSATAGPSRNAALLPSPADGSVWVSESGRVTHVDALGREVWALSAEARALAADPEDGSVWMLEGSTLVRRASDGSQLWRVAGFGAETCLGEDPRNQSVWAGDETARLAHLSATGEVLSENGNTRPVLDIAVLPSDGSLWVGYSSNPEDPADYAYVARLDASGTELFREGNLYLWFVNLYDGSAWIDDLLFSAEGEWLHRMRADAWWIAFDPVDSSYWGTEDPSDYEPSLSHYSVSGTRLWTQQRPWLGVRFWVDPSDGSCWSLNIDAFDYQPPVLIHVSPEGEELGRRPVPAALEQTGVVSTIGFSATDHTWWAQDGSALVHFAEDSTELWRQEDATYGSILGFEISPVDASVWLTSSHLPVSDTYDDIPLNSRLVHLSADGTLLKATDYVAYFWCLSLSTDGSFWVVSQDDETGEKLVRFSPAGEPIAQLPLPAGLSHVTSLEVRPSDGSLYGTGRSVDYAWPLADVVFRMAADGTLLWQLTGFHDLSMGLVPEDESLWIADRGETIPGPWMLDAESEVAHLDANGQYLWRGEAFNGPRYLKINSYDGTPWVFDGGNHQLVHLQATPSPFADVDSESWAFDAIVACADAGIVYGYWNGTYRPDQAVTRAQMAIYIARALAGGDANVHVPTGVVEPTFPDVDEEELAYRYVEYCAAHGIVEGYESGNYRPGLTVNRGQMAIFVARTVATITGTPSLEDFVPPQEPTFSDVTAENEWQGCYKYVEYLAALDPPVVEGYWNGTYRPEKAVTRAQMAVYIARAFHLLD